MTMAAYMLGTAAVPAKMICNIVSVNRFFGPCVTKLPFTSTVPMSGFPCSSKKPLDRRLFVPNSRSSMRRRSRELWRCIAVGRSPMVRVSGRSLGCGARRWSGEGGPRGGGQERKLGRRSLCFVKVGRKDGCVDAWIVEVVVWALWGVVVG